MKRSLIGGSLAVLLLLLTPAIAHAAVGDGVTIDMPTPGQVFASGTPVYLEAFVPADGYDYLGQICTGNAGCSGWVGPYSAGSVSSPVSVQEKGPDTGTAQLEAYDPSDPSTILWTSALINFTIQAPPPPRLSNFRISTRSFYPIVRDGFRDTVWARFSLSGPGTVQVLIEHSGGVVYRRSHAFGRAGAGAFPWNGQRTNGRRVLAGRYGIHVLFRGRKSLTLPVEVLHRQVRIGHSASKLGTRFSARGSSTLSLGGSCNWSTLDGSMLSTCLFAKAWVRYVFGAGHPVSGSVGRTKGIFACHSSRAVGVLHGHVEVTFTSANASGFSQCWIHHVSARWYDLIWR